MRPHHNRAIHRDISSHSSKHLSVQGTYKITLILTLHIPIFTYSHIRIFTYSRIHIFTYSRIHIFTYSSSGRVNSFGTLSFPVIQSYAFSHHKKQQHCCTIRLYTPIRKGTANSIRLPLTRRVPKITP